MKIESSALPAIDAEKGSARGARDDALTGKAGSAFDEAIQRAGETKAGGSLEMPDEMPTGATRDGDEARAQPVRKTAADEVVADDPAESGNGLQGLLLLIRAPADGVRSEGEPRDDRDEAVERGSGMSGSVPSDESKVPVDRRSQVRVLRTETHFEPRIDGALDARETALAAAVPYPSEPDDVAGHLARDLLRAVAPPREGMRDAAAANRNDRAADRDAKAATAALGGGIALRDEPVLAPARFDEVVARLGQPGAPASGPGQDAGRNGRESDRRGGERADATGRLGRAATMRSESATTVLVNAPDAGPSPASSVPGLALQVASRIADALEPARGSPTDRPTPFASPSGEAHLRLRAGGAALKTLTIQLQPEHLGTLEVSMRLREGKLAIELVASKPEAAAALTQDRETLRKVLEGAGFSLDEAAVTVTMRESAPVRVAEAGSSAQTGGSGDRSASSGDPSGGGGASREQERAAHTATDAPTHPRGTSETAPSRNAGQTYL